jgi:exopolysaccharide biosynthesis protein
MKSFKKTTKNHLSIGINFNRLAFVLAFTLLNSSTFAQNLDSIAFKKLNWQKQSISKGAELFQVQIADSSLFKSNQNFVYIAVSPQKKAPKFSFAYDEKTLMPTSVFGEKQQAIAAINGTFFDMKNGGSVDFLKVNQKIINENRLGKNLSRSFNQKSAVIINKGKLSIQKWDGTPNWESQLNADNIMTSGPLLRLDNSDEKIDSISFNTNRHPRTAVGRKADGTVLLFVADGRNKNAYGLSIYELAALMKWLGCVDAINLDGGGSTTLWVNTSGVVNYPSDNKKWDHEGQRKVANVIFIGNKEKQ